MIKCLLTWYENDVQKLYTIKRRWQNLIQYANFYPPMPTYSNITTSSISVLISSYSSSCFSMSFGICFTVLGICPHTLMLSCFVQNTLKQYVQPIYIEIFDIICCFRNNSQIIRFIHYHLNVSILANTSIKENLKIAIKRCWMKEEILQTE